MLDLTSLTPKHTIKQTAISTRICEQCKYTSSASKNDAERVKLSINYRLSSYVHTEQWQRLHGFQTTCTVRKLMGAKYTKTTLHHKWQQVVKDFFYKRLHCRGDFSSGKFNVTLCSFCHWPIGTLVDSMQGIPTSGPLGMVLGGIRRNPDVIPVKTVRSHRGVQTCI